MPWIRRRNRDLDDEISAHLSMSAREHMDRGESSDNARNAARREFGSEALVKEVTRERWGWAPWERVAQDLRYAARQLRANPGFTAAAVLTLSLGIGANSAIFSVVNAVLLNPLPYRDADRLVWGNGRTPNGYSRAAICAPDFRDYRDQNRSFEHLSVFFVRGAEPQSWSMNGEARQLKGTMVSAGFFEMLGFTPVLGRSFTPADEDRQAPEAAIISYHLWEQAFAGAADVIGRTVRIDSLSTTIVGVIPAALDFPSGVDFWYPTPMKAAGLQRRHAHMFRMIGRLRPGITLAQAQGDLDSIARRLGVLYPPTNQGWGASLRPMQDAIVGSTRPALLILLGAVGMVVLIACVNIANLLLARYGARQREIAIRTAIGASRLRIVSQLITENLLLAGLAGAIALLLANAGVNLLRSFGPPNLPRLNEVRLDGRVLLFTAGISALTALIFGLAPAWLATCVRSSGALRRRYSLGGALVVGETALSICLMIGAALLGQSLVRTLRASPGFSPQRILSAQLMLPRTGGPTRSVRLIRNLTAAIRALPGVEAVGGISELPIHNEFNDAVFTIVEHPPKAMQDRDDEDFRRVENGYFEAMNIPLLRGRLLDERDRTATARVLLIDEPFARRYFPGEDPVGMHIRFGDPVFEIIGVVGGVRNHNLRTAPRPTFYIPFTHDQSDRLHLVIRTASDSAALAGVVRQIVRSEDPEVAISAFETMEEALSASVSGERFNALLLGLFAALALSLGIVGVYGVFSYIVAQQTREIGVRMALGARPGQMLRLILRRGALLAAGGSVLGITAAFFLTGVLSTQLYGVAPRDPLTFAGAVLVLVTVALAACAIPARRAMRVDPLIALRCE